MLNLEQDFKEFLISLNEKEVQYMVVGAHAVALHSQPRSTGDFDIWVNTSNENAVKVAQAIHHFGFPLYPAEYFKSTDSVIQLGYPPFRIDVLTALDGLNFADAYSRSIKVYVEDIYVTVIGKEDLLINKLAVGRFKDLEDAEWLKSANSPGKTEDENKN